MVGMTRNLAQAMALHLCVHVSWGSSESVDGIVNSTDDVISQLTDLERHVQQGLLNSSTIDEALDRATSRTEAEFAYILAEKNRLFNELASHASGKASECLRIEGPSNLTYAMNESSLALAKMIAVDVEVTEVEDKLRRTLNARLKDIQGSALSVVHNFEHNVSKLQHQAHRVMDPLYGMGDDAEDIADRLNDRTNNAESSIERKLRHHVRAIGKHANKDRKRVELQLQLTRDERRKTRNSVEALVQKVSMHMAELTGSGGHASALLQRLRSGPGLAVPVTMFVFTAALLSMAAKLRGSRHTYLQPLLTA